MEGEERMIHCWVEWNTEVGPRHEGGSESESLESNRNGRTDGDC